MWNNYDESLLQGAYEHDNRPTQESEDIWVLFHDKKLVHYGPESEFSTLADDITELDSGLYELGHASEYAFNPGNTDELNYRFTTVTNTFTV